VRLGLLFAGVFVLATLVACGRGGGSNLPSPPPAGPGTVVGVYVRADRQGQAVTAGREVQVGAYQEAFLPGTVMASPPQPVATASTDGQGRFRIGPLEPGRYFVVAIDPVAVTTGTWVDISVGAGATVGLRGCTDCPAPQ
jgi:hypothetical protein